VYDYIIATDESGTLDEHDSEDEESVEECKACVITAMEHAWCHSVTPTQRNDGEADAKSEAGEPEHMDGNIHSAK